MDSKNVSDSKMKLKPQRDELDCQNVSLLGGPKNVSTKEYIIRKAELMDIEYTSELKIKLEPQIDELDLQNVALGSQNLFAKEYIIQKRKLIIRLEKLKIIKKNGELIIENQHQILNAVLAQHEEPICKQESPAKIETSENAFKKMHDGTYNDSKIEIELLDIEEEYVEQNETGYEEPFDNRESPSASAKLETSENACKKMHDVTTLIGDWKIKSELLDIKEEYVEQNATGISVNPVEHKRTCTIHKHQCNCQPVKKSKLKRKLSRHKNPDKIDMFRCDQCKFQTIQKTNFKRHCLLHKDPEEAKMFKCDQCEFRTIYKNSFEGHLLRHKDPKEVYMFKCAQCEYQTNQKSNLKAHVLRHKDPNKVNRFKCNQCEYQTIWKANLKKHLLRHKDPNKVRTFKCNQCEYQTKYKANLKLHCLKHKYPKGVFP